MGFSEEDVARILERAKDVDRRINAFVTYNERAPQEASEVLRKGLEPLPMGVKDNIYTKGLRTTMASRIYADHVPSEDAAVVGILKRLGWVVVGKTNLHEFASGVTTTSSIFGPTRNPLDPERIAGGSSGGSAAAVAAGLVPMALGNDAAGSVRIPASLCGVYGLRPSRGLVSSEGIYPLSPSLETPGFIAQSLDWIERPLRAFTGPRGARARGGRLRIGIPSWFRVPEDLRILYPDLVERVEEEFLNRISATGHDHVEVEMPAASERVWRLFPVIRYSEATRIHMRNRGSWDLYFPDVRRLLEKGLGYTALEYAEAQAAREEVLKEHLRVLRRVDVLATPSTPVPAPRIGDVLGREDGPVRSLLTYEALYASYIGAPAISIPFMKIQGLPVGLQLIGRPGGDLELLEMARMLSS